MTPDGTFWFASLSRGLASVTPRTIGAVGDFVTTYTNVPGLPASGLMDLAADPDGTLWIADNIGRLLRFNPATLTVRVWPGSNRTAVPAGMFNRNPRVAARSKLNASFVSKK